MSTLEECLGGVPKTIKIGPYDWKVVLEAGDEGDRGEANFDHHHIRIWPHNLADPQKAVGVVLHECFHVVFDNQGLGKLPRGKEDREEQIVLAFEAGLVALFRDNPKLFTWMRKWLK
jgi:hypothetical protein